MQPATAMFTVDRHAAVTMFTVDRHAASNGNVYSGQTCSSDNVYSGQTCSSDNVYSGQTCSQQRPVAAAEGCRSQFAMQVAMAADKQHQHKQPLPCLPPTGTVAL